MKYFKSLEKSKHIPTFLGANNSFVAYMCDKLQFGLIK